jgi:hypothetical protein
MHTGRNHSAAVRVELDRSPMAARPDSITDFAERTNQVGY